MAIKFQLFGNPPQISTARLESLAPTLALMAQTDGAVLLRDELHWLMHQANLAEPKICKWENVSDENMPFTYHSECGETWSFVDHGIDVNRVGYCQNCGGRVEEQKDE